MAAERTALPFKIFSGDGGTGLDIKAGLINGGVETAEEEVAAVVVGGFILTLAPSAFTRLGIFSKLTTGTGTLKKNKGTHMHGCLLWSIWSTEELHPIIVIRTFPYHLFMLLLEVSSVIPILMGGRFVL